MDELLILRFIHILGLCLMAGGLLGVFVSDMRSRQAKSLESFGQVVTMIALFYDGLVVPGALLLAASGTWLIVSYYDGWSFLEVPWLTGMVLLFVLEFVEGNTITRLFFMRLRRLTIEAQKTGDWTTELKNARGEQLASFTHFLDLPALFVIISLAVLRPDSWIHFFIGSGIAIIIATILNIYVPRLYPWR